jgi:transcriptional regulator with XRE-family HTH domain
MIVFKNPSFFCAFLYLSIFLLHNEVNKLSITILLRFGVMSTIFNPILIKFNMTDIINKTYTKKLAIENEHSTPEARAERLRRIRNLANLSRKDICGSDDININTYKGWELGRFGGLPVDGAEKVVKIIARSGVICSTEWLLYGKKPAPTLISEVTASEGDANTEETDNSLIQKEFAIYQDATKNAVLIEVTDDGLSPDYQIGDFLAGEKKFNDDIELTLDQVCIVETTDGKKLVRYVKQGHEKGLYTLICTNYRTAMCDVIIKNVRLLYSTIISRHYKTVE